VGEATNLSDLGSTFSQFNVGARLGLVTGLVGSIVSIVLLVVISVYLLIEGRAVIATLRRLFPAHTRMFDFMVLAVGSTADAYVRGQVLMSLLIGVYTTVTMAALGVHFAVVLGVAAAILELVPLIGAVIAMALAVGVAFLQSPTLGIAAVVVGLMGHAIEAYIVGPRVSGRVTRLHPLVAMAGLLIGAEVAGVLGALFGVPIAAIANIVLGAAYRWHQGATPLTTSARGKIKADTLPRLGDEIGRRRSRWDRQRSGAARKGDLTGVTLRTAILDLPGVVHHVPRKAPRRVTRRPRLTRNARSERPGIRDPLLTPRAARRQADADLAAVTALRITNVLDDRVAVPTTSARPFSQLRRGPGDDAVEDRPCLLEQLRDAVRLGRWERSVIPFAADTGRAEICRRITGDLTDDLEVRRDCAATGDHRIAGRIPCERLERLWRAFAASTPTRPVDGTRERPCLAGLEVDASHAGHQPESASFPETPPHPPR
jgi:hypothetical protein